MPVDAALDIVWDNLVYDVGVNYVCCKLPSPEFSGMITYRVLHWPKFAEIPISVGLLEDAASGEWFPEILYVKFQEVLKL